MTTKPTGRFKVLFLQGDASSAFYSDSHIGHSKVKRIWRRILQLAFSIMPMIMLKKAIGYRVSDRYPICEISSRESRKRFKRARNQYS